MVSTKKAHKQKAKEGRHRFPLMVPLTFWGEFKEFAAYNHRPVTQEILLAMREAMERAKRRAEDE